VHLTFTVADSPPPPSRYVRENTSNLFLLPHLDVSSLYGRKGWGLRFGGVFKTGLLSILMSGVLIPKSSRGGDFFFSILKLNFRRGKNFSKYWPSPRTDAWKAVPVLLEVCYFFSLRG